MQRRAVLIIVGFISAACWVQLFRLVDNTSPTPLTVMLALGLLFGAVGGIGTLASWYILRRAFNRDRVFTALRHGIWLGLLVTVYGWLQLVGVLTPLIAAVLLGILITAESLFLLRELST
ncbi:MAG: hypothetical protein M5U01_12460 [Ardenticatenaceae bacterium]|nr:hypothetical protein [Ardenticatenaceae bacterium]HBY98834.1 hypothetical protein [Chloroflexota bacterium]